MSWHGNGNHLSNRSVTLSLGNTMRSRLLTCGTPQEGILSPLVWNVVFDSLLNRLMKGLLATKYIDLSGNVKTLIK